MTRWEYRTVHFEARNAFDGTVNYLAEIVGGSGLGYGVASSEAIDSTLNQFGAEGWELVNVFTLSVRGDAPVIAAVFKRPSG